MEGPYNDLPTSHLIGSVPAVISEENKTSNYAAVEANAQNSPRHQRGDRGLGYQKIASSSGGGGPPPADNWQGVFSISSYTQYFNVDTDDVLNRLLNSLNPLRDDFCSKIDANPDLYGLVWVSTTLVFVTACLGNLATYLRHRSSWRFNVGYVSLAASVIYAYAIVVPLGFYFLLRYFGLNPSLVRLWCMWGYSLFIFVLSCILLVIPVELLGWTVIIIAGGVSAWFVASNLRSYVEGNSSTFVLVAALVLQFALGLFIKFMFFA